MLFGLAIRTFLKDTLIEKIIKLYIFISYKKLYINEVILIDYFDQITLEDIKDFYTFIICLRKMILKSYM